jgi:parvulin-like peptidyl-prolyl isomerase
MKTTPAVVLTIAVAALGGASCRSTPTASAPTPAAVSPDTWATVDGRTISRDTVDKAYRRTRDLATTLAPEEELTAKLSVLNEIIVQELLIAKAGELKISVPESDLETAYNNAKSNMKEEAFQEELQRRNVTAADMRESLRRELLTQKVLEQEVVSKISVSDQDVSDFFNANKDRFNVKEEAYALAQIVVTPVRDPQPTNRTGDDATTAEQATAKTAMLMERLKGGASFRDLALDFSEDADSASRGGDLGLVPVSRLMQAPPAMRNAVLKKEPGSVTVASLGGTHTIVLVMAHEMPGQRDLSMPAVKDGITQTLKARKEQLLRAAFLTALQSDTKVVNHLARRVVDNKGKVP